MKPRESCKALGADLPPKIWNSCCCMGQDLECHTQLAPNWDTGLPLKVIIKWQCSCSSAPSQTSLCCSFRGVWCSSSSQEMGLNEGLPNKGFNCLVRGRAIPWGGTSLRLKAAPSLSPTASPSDFRFNSLNTLFLYFSSPLAVMQNKWEEGEKAQYQREEKNYHL